MRTFIHHNPLHGLEEPLFDQAVSGRTTARGKGYLPGALYRRYGRRAVTVRKILTHVLTPLAGDRR